MGRGMPEALQGMNPASIDPAAMERTARQLDQGGGLPGPGGLRVGLSGLGHKR